MALCEEDGIMLAERGALETDRIDRKKDERQERDSNKDTIPVPRSAT